jgi:hypothetical protein
MTSRQGWWEVSIEKVLVKDKIWPKGLLEIRPRNQRRTNYALNRNNVTTFGEPENKKPLFGSWIPSRRPQKKMVLRACQRKALNYITLGGSSAKE